MVKAKLRTSSLHEDFLRACAPVGVVGCNELGMGVDRQEPCIECAWNPLTFGNFVPFELSAKLAELLRSGIYYLRREPASRAGKFFEIVKSGGAALFLLGILLT